jgi:hypothetical protein
MAPEQQLSFASGPHVATRPLQLGGSEDGAASRRVEHAATNPGDRQRPSVPHDNPLGHPVATEQLIAQSLKRASYAHATTVSAIVTARSFITAIP